MSESTGDNRRLEMKPNVDDDDDDEKTQQVDKRRTSRSGAMTPGKLLNNLASLSLIVSLLSLTFTFYNHRPFVDLADAARTTTPNLPQEEQPLLLWQQQQQQQPRWQPHRESTPMHSHNLTSRGGAVAGVAAIRHRQQAESASRPPTISNRQQQVVVSTTPMPLPPTTTTAAAPFNTSTVDSLSTANSDSDVVTAESSYDPADSPDSSATEDDGAVSSIEPEEPDSLDRRADDSVGPETTGQETRPDGGQPDESVSATFEGIHVRPSRESAPHTTTTTQATTTSRGATQPASTTLRGGGSTAQSSFSSRSTPAITTTSAPNVLRRQQVAPASVATQPPVPRQAAPSFDVNVGADRMLIKPAASGADRDFHAGLFSSAPTPLADASGRGGTTPQAQANRTTFANFLSRSPSQQTSARPITTTTTTTTTTTMTPVAPEDEDESSAGENNGSAPTSHELVNESVTHHQHVPMVSSEVERERLMYPPLPVGAAGGGRLRDPPSAQVGGLNQQDHLQPQPQPQGHHHQHHHEHNQQHQELAVASICYTPMSLFLVILVTIGITLAVCFCTLHLVRHLKRHHQFDLVANTKHFDHKHLSGASSSAGFGLIQSGTGSGSSASIHRAYQPTGALHSSSPVGASSAAMRLGTCMLHPFQRDDQCNKCHRATSSCGPLAQTSVSSEPGGTGGGYAFRNPYFADELSMQQEHQQPRRSPASSADAGNVRLVARGECSPAGDRVAAMPLGVELGGGGNEHMHFIESHIANLHNRQVTSSVKELSSLSGHDHHHQHLVAVAPQVVDLTSDEQRARARAHPQEGDLVAVDLSGHDIIGLGFDVCGGNGPRDRGIFVRSISAHGPASESGLIHAGDRIKCLNVTFECMTLQDARDILNCAAPYRMRLLLEKRVARSSELEMMPGFGSVHHRVKSGAAAASSRSRGRTLPAAAGAPTAGKNPLETTRDYLKQLTGRIMGAGHGGGGGDDESENESQRQLNVASERTSSPVALSQQVAASSSAAAGGGGAPIGSRAARQQMQRLEPAAPPVAINEISERARERPGRLSGASSVDQSSLLLVAQVEASSGASEEGAQSHQSHNHNKRRHKPQVAGESAGGRHRGHRRAESCHINEAFRPADDDEDDEHEHDRENENENENDERESPTPPPPSTTTGHARPRPSTAGTGTGLGTNTGLANNCDDDNELEQQASDDRHLFDYDDRQNKLMASGQTFNSASSTSRLTM